MSMEQTCKGTLALTILAWTSFEMSVDYSMLSQPYSQAYPPSSTTTDSNIGWPQNFSAPRLYQSTWKKARQTIQSKVPWWGKLGGAWVAKLASHSTKNPASSSTNRWDKAYSAHYASTWSNWCRKSVNASACETAQETEYSCEASWSTKRRSK